MTIVQHANSGKKVGRNFKMDEHKLKKDIDKHTDYHDKLTQLAASKGTTNYPDQYSADILESFDNQFPDSSYMVTLNCPEFTTVCEITGQPDFGKIIINYIPDAKLVESKSLKLYMFGFRNAHFFHEHAVCTIGLDLVKLLNPHYLEVQGFFLPRGGISIDPFYSYSTEDWDTFKHIRLANRNMPIRS